MQNIRPTSASLALNRASDHDSLLVKPYLLSSTMQRNNDPNMNFPSPPPRVSLNTNLLFYIFVKMTINFSRTTNRSSFQAVRCNPNDHL